MRRFGETPKRGQAYRPRHGAYAILIRDGDVLLTHQALPEPEFQLPGGGIDPGESAIQALHREVYEETGWAIAQPQRLGAYRRFTFMPDYDRWAEKICTIYLARPVIRRGAPLEPGHEAVWCRASQAADLVGSEGDRHFLRHAILSFM
ncbi:NUDIX domain-containing protein [Albirhodobacter sp. R86504]|uniref:NUDIX domain-containing protein n=1 Tax=Albirhodobacter sp. R86504 TaxID=3093848 RepID=UPI003673454E